MTQTIKVTQEKACIHCNGTIFVHVPETRDTIENYECHGCGRGWLLPQEVKDNQIKNYVISKNDIDELKRTIKDISNLNSVGCSRCMVLLNNLEEKRS